jgi:tRNA threonylcarbamoyl adenosine modification protein (Sua5/YciO/YrdC/YwlC family)
MSPSTRITRRKAVAAPIYWRGKATSARLSSAVEALRAGGLVIFPTDTVYGLGASVFRPAAVRRIYRLKGRSYKKPLPILVADVAQALPLVEPPSDRLRRLIDDHWPGPLTVVFKTSSLGRLATGGKSTVAIRVPDHAGARALLKAMGSPLAVTSANPSGEPPAVTGAQAKKIFGGRVEVLWDGGRCRKGVASTVLDASGPAWTLVREGAIPKRKLLTYLDIVE